MDISQEFFGANAGYVQDLYERYLRDPFSVDPESRAYFASLDRQKQAQAEVPAADLRLVIQAANYVQAIRTYGHLAANLDPLGSPPPGDPSLELSSYGLSEADLRTLPSSVASGPVAEQAANALEAVQALQKIYCGTTGYEYGHIRVPEERDWLRQVAEARRYQPPNDPVDEAGLLDRLTQVEVFEQFLHRHFPGKTRFSIEGVDMLVPLLDNIIGCSADGDICVIMLGMAHRGRLNVLAHILHMTYSQILAEFKDPHKKFAGLDQLGWTGDVKYHKGALRAMKSGQEVKLVISMAPNPSHLEHVNPVVEGMARSAGSKTNQPGPPVFYPLAALPVLVHGDAAFPAEGIVAETLNLSKLPGYETAGTVHVITNNQLGFTTFPGEGRSTQYASDLAKGFEIPIIHVNADDPLAVIGAARTAYAYRDKFHKDILIDLVGYRRYGHNEGDEPSFTQPLMYHEIDAHPTVRAILAKRLVEQNKIDPGEPDKLIENWMADLQKALDELKEDEGSPAPPAQSSNSDDFRPRTTRLAVEELRRMNEALLAFPQGFTLNRKLDRPIQRRKKALDDPEQKTIDWGTAEELALAAILADGIPVRLTGQDVERGTFSQRHAVFHDVQTGEVFIPLQAIPQAKAAFDIHNSPLSENAALGFEFGYSALYPDRMDIWEAQYGDFINAAQVMVDEFLASAQAKWVQKPSLVLLLPHGYEGQGPDHSSGRVERFLQLATPSTMRVANCTTAAQYFHLLRLQAATLKTNPVPLVIFTPKSLLRHPMVASSAVDLAEGEWSPILDDPTINDPGAVKQVLFCTGKVAIDLLSHENRAEHADTAIIRLEQLVPFPHHPVQRILDRYKNTAVAAWVQEEPENMGAWAYVQPFLAELIAGRFPLRYIGRGMSSSPAEGSFSWHEMNQSALIARAFSRERKEASEGVIVIKG